MTPALDRPDESRRSLAFYKNRFADASDFTFVFVGSFDLATIRPLVERYLGSLPALHRTEAAKDVGIRPPTGVVERRGRERASSRRARSASSSPDRSRTTRRTGVAREPMAEMLGGNLHRTLREDLGGTYGVSVEPRFTQRPTESYRITISFACDPARTESLTKTAFEVIEQFRREGPSEAQVADTRQALMRDFETSSQQNRSLLSRLVYSYEYAEPVDAVFDIRPSVNRLTASSIHEAARAYLDTRRYVEVTLLPEK